VRILGVAELKTALNRWRHTLARSVPKPLGTLPYGFALRAVKLISATAHLPYPPEIWPRNSYALGTLVPIVSDLDLTVWLSEGLTQSQFSALLMRLDLARKAMPWIGEINFYLVDDLPFIAPHFNCYELARDPALQRKLEQRGCTVGGPLPPPTDSKAHACSFLLRMLEADLRQVTLQPASRTEKWRSHFETVGQPWPSPEPRALREAVLRASVTLLGLTTDPDLALASLKRYFDARVQMLPLGALPIEPLWRACFPHRFCWEPGVPPVTEERLAQIMLAQISWEIVGIYTQFRLPKLPRHLTDLIQFLGRSLLTTPWEPDAVGPIRDLRELKSRKAVTLL
jgi:hypothetical protein